MTSSRLSSPDFRLHLCRPQTLEPLQRRRQLLLPLGRQQGLGERRGRGGHRDHARVLRCKRAVIKNTRVVENVTVNTCSSSPSLALVSLSRSNFTSALKPPTVGRKNGASDGFLQTNEKNHESLENNYFIWTQIRPHLTGFLGLFLALTTSMLSSARQSEEEETPRESESVTWETQKRLIYHEANTSVQTKHPPVLEPTARGRRRRRFQLPPLRRHLFPS